MIGSGLMSEWWDQQIRRADDLTLQAQGSKELLRFYAQLLRAQQAIYDFFRSRNGWLPSGNLENDLPVMRQALARLLTTVAAHGPQTLADEARELFKMSDEVVDEMLISYWRTSSDVQFFAKAFMQPYARWLVESGGKPSEAEPMVGQGRCPFCGGSPQASFLKSKESNAESGNRDLICAKCLSTWEFRRVVCANCGEERPNKLGYFHSPEFDHIRIEACDICKRYIKGVDLTKLGFAAPLVDEI
jgi:FdhE protein